MLFDINFVDIFAFIFIAIYAWFAFRRGFLGELFELIGFSLSLLWALVFFPFLSFLLQKLFLPTGLSNTLAFLSIWIITELFLLRVNQDIFKTLPMHFIISRFNRYLGIIPNILSSLFIIAFVGTLLVVLPTNSLVKAQVTQSQIVGRIISLTSVFNSSLESAFSKSVRESLVFLTSDKSKQDKKFIDLNFPPTLSVQDDTSSEEELFELLNTERTKRGLWPLKKEDTLSAVAREHSRDMFLRSYFGHVDPDGRDPLFRLAGKGLEYKSLAENLSYAPDASTAHQGLMYSEEHRKAILSPKYTRVGIGVVDSGNYGKMITQFFAD